MVHIFFSRRLQAQTWSLMGLSVVCVLHDTPLALGTPFIKSPVFVAENDRPTQQTSPNSPLESQKTGNAGEDPSSSQEIISSPKTQESDSSIKTDPSEEEEIENIQNDPDDPE